MILSYDEIFSEFLGNVTDYNIINLSEDEAKELMKEYLHKSMSQIHVRSLFSTIAIDDELQLISFVMSNKTDDFSDKEFVLTVIGKAMMIEWLAPQVRSKVNIAQFFTNTEAKFYSQSNHISELRAMLEDAKLEVRKMIRDRGYVYNSYLEEE